MFDISGFNPFDRFTYTSSSNSFSPIFSSIAVVLSKERYFLDSIESALTGTLCEFIMILPDTHLFPSGPIESSEYEVREIEWGKFECV